MATIKLKPLPLSHSFLDRYCTQARKHHPPGMLGGHLTHRKGQSLEFREFVEYTTGDDIRYVDWRASARYKERGDWLVRNFRAEENYTLAISIDTRDTMHWPIALPKLQIAAWVAETLARIALYSDDRVILHRLYGRSKGGLEKLKNAGRDKSIFPTLQRFVEHPSENIVDLQAFSYHLPPAAVWLIITDFYFNLDEEVQKLAQRITTAQTGWRWILLLDMDSWSFEKALLGIGARRIEGPGIESTEKKFKITKDSIGKVEKNISDHKEEFRDKITRVGYDLIRWEWPTPEDANAEKFFRTCFSHDKILPRLFMKQL